MPLPNSTRVGLLAAQWAHLQELLRTVIPANPFCTAKLRAAQVEAEQLASLHDFTRLVPFTTKAEIVEDQRAHAPYGTNLTFPLERYTRFHQTSGTTGKPLCWLDTPESWDQMVDGWAQVLQAAGVERADCVLFAFTFGPFIGFWMAFEAAERMGCLCLPGGGLSSAARLRLLLDHAVTVLCCTPTYAARLAEVAAEDQIDLRAARVKTIIVAGEPGGSIPAVRARLERLWHGARIFDHHGMTEVGPVTYECPAAPGRLHVLENAFLAEVVDPKTGRPAAAGAVGELILTPLRRAGSPLLRYRTGDLVRPVHQPAAVDSPPCACGRYELALEGGILGRADDMLIIRGVNVFPSAVEDIIQTCGEVAEYRADVSVQDELTQLRLQVEPAADCANPSGLERRLQKALHDAFALRVPVSVVPRGALPRQEMKAHRWVRR